MESHNRIWIRFFIEAKMTSKNVLNNWFLPVDCGYFAKIALVSMNDFQFALMRNVTIVKWTNYVIFFYYYFILPRSVLSSLYPGKLFIKIKRGENRDKYHHFYIYIRSICSIVVQDGLLTHNRKSKYRNCSVAIDCTGMWNATIVSAELAVENTTARIKHSERKIY